MKKKSKIIVAKKRNEFRFHATLLKRENNKNKRLRHPAYVFLEQGNIYVYVSITHSDKVNDNIVIKLKKNPNPKDTRDSYRIVDIKKDTKDRFSKKTKRVENEPGR